MHLQKQVDSCIQDYILKAEIRKKKTIQDKCVYPYEEEDERERLYGDKNPLKAKLRQLNKEATKLFLKQRIDTMFFDKFADLEVKREREERF